MDVVLPLPVEFPPIHPLSNHRQGSALKLATSNQTDAKNEHLNIQQCDKNVTKMTGTNFGGKKNISTFEMYFEFLVMTEVLPEITEEGFMACTAAHHQGAIKTFWPQFWRPLWLSSFSHAVYAQSLYPA